MILLKNCRFIDELTEKGLTSGDILIEGGLIGEVDASITPEGFVTTYDMKGGYVLPGFIDLHVHLSSSGGDVLYDNFTEDYYLCMQSYKYALDTMKIGFTTLRDVGSNNRMVNGIRDYIDSGNLPGPRIISSGKIITPSESGNEYFEKMYVECDGPAEVQKGVREEIKKGADFIKIMASGAIMNPGGDPGSPVYSDEEIIKIVETARLKGKYVAAHAHSAQAIKQCFRCGVATIEHASVMDSECIALALASKDTSIVPTVTAFMDLVEDTNEDAQFINEKIKSFGEEFKRTLKKAYEAGVVMGFGTDQGVTGSFHGKNYNEFIYRSDVISMKEIDILKQATIYSAAIVGLSHHIGSIHRGKAADLVVLSANPLEDIRACRDNIETVIKNGEFV